MGNNNKSKLFMIEARAVLAAIMMIGSFILLPVFAIFAPDFFQQIYILVFSQLGWITGYYFGAKNGEKRQEQLLRYLLTLALRGAGVKENEVVKIV